MDEVPGTLIGIYQYVIGGLMTSVGALVAGNVFQYRSAEKVNGYRLAERDTLNKALLESNQVLASIKETIEQRNAMMEKLAALITQQGSAFALFAETMRHQQELAARDRHDAHVVMTAMAQSVQLLTTSINKVNDGIDDLMEQVKSNAELIEDNRR